MAERAWVFIPDPDGKHRRGIKIECAECGAEDFHAPNSGGRFPKKAAQSRFERAGWTVGNGPRRDFCPKCTAKKAEKPKSSNVVEMKKPMATSVNAPPRLMSRDDRRLIIAEVKGCYDEENKRYMDGWHDERIAQALGSHVPVAWVKECREDYFGEGSSNEQFDELLKRIALAETEFLRIEKMELSVAVGVSELQKTIEALKPLVRDVKRAIGK